MWSTRKTKRKSGSRLGNDKRGVPAFDTVSLHSNLGSPRRNYFSIITTDLNVLHFGSITSKRILKLYHWWLKNKERKFDFRFVERKCLAAINLTGSAEGALVPVLLRITHWTKRGLPVSPPGLIPPWYNGGGLTADRLTPAWALEVGETVGDSLNPAQNFAQLLIKPSLQVRFFFGCFCRCNQALVRF